MRRHWPHPSETNSWNTSLFSAFAFARASVRVLAHTALPGPRAASVDLDGAVGAAGCACAATSADRPHPSAAAAVRFKTLDVGIRRDNPSRAAGIPSRAGERL